MNISLPSGVFGVEEAGHGVPLVFLHGFPHTRALWTQQMAALSVKARCIAPDLRGFGESVVQGPWTIDRYADDVRELLDHFGIERAIFAGLSMGGYIALACWRRFPERVLGLALLDTQASADDEAGRARRDAMMLRARTDGVDAVVEALLPGMIGKTTRAQRPDVEARMTRMMRAASVEGIVGALQVLRDRPDASDTVRTIVVPTLVVVGDEDVLTPPAKAETLIKLLPTATPRQYEVIAGAGHASGVERPAAVNHVLSEFLELVQSDQLYSQTSGVDDVR